jgi:predicted PurR-regulated permease PerM
MIQALALMSPIVVPCAAAPLLAALLNPLNKGLRQAPFPNGLAAVLSVLVLLGVGGVVVYATATRLDTLISEVGYSLGRVQDFFRNGSLLVDHDILDRLGRRLQQCWRAPAADWRREF